MNDILVHCMTKDEHNERLCKVLPCLQDNGMTLKKDKCVFGNQGAKFLGHIIDQEQIHDAAAKVKVVQDTEPQKLSSAIMDRNFRK